MKKLSRIAMAVLVSASAAPALAHHPLAGAPMESFTQGLLSGVGHPILGFDHLAFVVLVGIAAACCQKLYSAPLGYIGGMLAGCLLMMAGVSMPFAEVIIGGSLLVMGYLIMSGHQLSTNTLIAAFAAFGLFHGSAFGESIVGLEAGYGLSVAFGYLLGLGVAQYIIAALTAVSLRRIGDVFSVEAIPARLAAAVVTGVGLFLTLENIESAAFSALGLA